jgi:1-aminocyclopropane-1-carboxylate deaminase/D-cysteine desulfhydrase-like pyridoxal-dependent ACC family enzyme
LIEAAFSVHSPNSLSQTTKVTATLRGCVTVVPTEMVANRNEAGMSLERERQLEEALARLPRTPLASVRPTPLEPLARLSAHLNGPALYIKRDDLTGLGFGGNKTRMLEFSLAQAQATGSDTLVTGAAVQSNYCRQMAAACAKLGLELHLVLRPHREKDKHEIQGNHFLQRLFGAHVTILPDYDPIAHANALRAKAQELTAAGKRVFVPRQPETVDLDAIAYAEVALEIVRQVRALQIDPEFLYTSALDTTQAGLVLGFSFIRSPIQVRGVSPFEKTPQRMENMAAIANQAAARMQLPIQFGARDFVNDDSYVGERYSIPTPEGIEAIHLLARTEGILLDPVYTSKAMAKLMQDIKDGTLERHAPVLFMHTGGSPALFGYVPEVLG